MNMKLIFALLAVIFLIAGCTDSTISGGTPRTPGSSENAPPQVPSNENSSPPPVPEQSSPQVHEVSLKVFQFGFDPDTVTVKKGEKVKLLLTSTDVTHGISIDGYGMDAVLRPGVETPLEFTATKSGTFSFYCSVFCGSGHKTMTGKLVVQ